MDFGLGLIDRCRRVTLWVTVVRLSVCMYVCMSVFYRSNCSSAELCCLQRGTVAMLHYLWSNDGGPWLSCGGKIQVSVDAWRDLLNSSPEPVDAVGSTAASAALDTDSSKLPVAAWPYAGCWSPKV